MKITKLLKPVVRESGAYDRSEEIVVKLQPQFGPHVPSIELRLKNSRGEGLSITVEGLWQELNRRKVEQQRRDRAIRRPA